RVVGYVRFSEPDERRREYAHELAGQIFVREAAAEGAPVLVDFLIGRRVPAVVIVVGAHPAAQVDRNVGVERHAEELLAGVRARLGRRRAAVNRRDAREYQTREVGVLTRYHRI